MTTTYLSGGDPIEVATPYQPGWTDAQWLARHSANVADSFLTFPPDHP